MEVARFGLCMIRVVQVDALGSGNAEQGVLGIGGSGLEEICLPFFFHLISCCFARLMYFYDQRRNRSHQRPCRRGCCSMNRTVSSLNAEAVESIVLASVGLTDI